MRENKRQADKPCGGLELAKEVPPPWQPSFIKAPPIEDVRVAPWPEAVKYPEKKSAATRAAPQRNPRRPGGAGPPPGPPPEPPATVRRNFPPGVPLRYDGERNEWRVATAGNS